MIEALELPGDFHITFLFFWYQSRYWIDNVWHRGPTQVLQVVRQMLGFKVGTACSIMSRQRTRDTFAPTLPVNFQGYDVTHARVLLPHHARDAVLLVGPNDDRNALARGSSRSFWRHSMFKEIVKRLIESKNVTVFSHNLVLFMIHRVLEGEMSSLAQTDSDRGSSSRMPILIVVMVHGLHVILAAVQVGPAVHQCKIKYGQGMFHQANERRRL
mmetsp:Transcript_7796/g.13497  ORF Transcript_7796/g.13497 Transcript_7796/m.13497 type:complete len:214 (-) Transcript_7796:276-917(-)